MTEENSGFAEWEAEVRELNNDLVVPAYRRFCEELRIPFHFWDQLASAFDPEIALKEDSLHKEAMDLFNRLKPELVLFKDHVVSFHFTDWGGGFTHTKVPLADFLETAADDAFFLEKLRSRFELVTGALAILIGFCAAALVTWLTSRWIERFELFVFGGVLLWVSISLGKRIKRLPRHIVDDGRLNNVWERLKSLRRRLDEIRGSKPNPLDEQRSVRLGMLVLGELSETMEPEQIRRLVRRLQSNLRLVRPPENSA